MWTYRQVWNRLSILGQQLRTLNTRLNFQNVGSRRADPPLFQCLGECCLVDNTTPRDVDEQGLLLHRLQFRFSNHIYSAWVFWTSQNQHRNPLQYLFKRNSRVSQLSSPLPLRDNHIAKPNGPCQHLDSLPQSPIPHNTEHLLTRGQRRPVKEPLNQAALPSPLIRSRSPDMHFHNLLPRRKVQPNRVFRDTRDI